MRLLQTKRMIILIKKSAKSLFYIFIILFTLSLNSCTSTQQTDFNNNDINNKDNDFNGNIISDEDNDFKIINKRKINKLYKKRTTNNIYNNNIDNETSKPEINYENVENNINNNTKENNSNEENNINSNINNILEEKTVTEVEPNNDIPNSQTTPSNNGTNSKNNNYINKNSKDWNTIDNIVYAANNYYQNYYNKTKLISLNGKLYNSSSNEYIDSAFLVNNSELSGEYIDSKVELFLVYGKDISKFENVTIKSSDMDLGIFGVKKSSDNIYLISSIKSSGGIMSFEEYNTLLSTYNQSHGIVRRLNPSSEEYKRIITFVKIYEGSFEEYFVRSVTCDDKYASVIFSTQEQPNKIKHYILIKENNFWEVLINDLESSSRSVLKVNKEIPDLNLNILPDYEVSNFKTDLDKTSFLNSLINLNYISNEDDISYISGTSNYCYVINKNGTRFLGILKENNWSISNILNYTEAYNKMKSYDTNAPTFILLDE